MPSASRSEDQPYGLAVNVFLVIPLAWLVIFGTLILRARMHTRVWPVARHGNPFDGSYVDTTIDPNVFQLHGAAVWVGFLALQLVVPLSVILLALGIFYRPMRTSVGMFQCFGASVACILAIVLFDPGGYWRWFID